MSNTSLPTTAIYDRQLSSGDWIGFAAMVLGNFIAILDIQIVSSLLQQIQAGLSASRDEITWVTTFYLIAEVGIVPLTGWLARDHQHGLTRSGRHHRKSDVLVVGRDFFRSPVAHAPGTES